MSVNFFGLTIRLYGIIAAVSIYLVTTIISKILKSERLPEDIAWDALVWVFVCGIIGARSYHVVDLWNYYSLNISDIVMVWKGGLGIFGGIAGGIVGICLYSKYKNLSRLQLLKLLDASAICLPLGQSLGRWGNYFNQELYGLPTTVPWAIEIDPVNRLAEYSNSSRYHPLFFYESVLNAVLFLLLYLIWSKKKLVLGNLQIGALYLIGYGLIRFMLEPFRLDKWVISSGLPTAQLISSIIIVMGIYIFLYRKRQCLK